MLLGRARQAIFGISADETRFDRRGFGAAAPDVQQRLEQVGRTFLEGYHAALNTARPASLESRLEGIEPERRGWGFEGAAMALALQDELTPWNRSRLTNFLAGPGDRHAYMMHVGAGWAMARLNRPQALLLNRLDPILRWLAYDGWGFHEGYFNWKRCCIDLARPQRLGGYALRAFDQGLGRCLWFIAGANVERIVALIHEFPLDRQADLWSGIGLASTYAGGMPEDIMFNLRRASGAFSSNAAQGAAFAAKARLRAGNCAPQTDMACNVWCDMTADEAAIITDETSISLSDRHECPAYERWRQRIQARFERSEVLT